MYHNKELITSKIPDNMRNLPFADNQGIVLSTKYIELDGPKTAYNSSIVWNHEDNKYMLIFREDIKGNTKDATNGARIGIVDMDDDFNQVGKCRYPLLTGFENREKNRKKFEVTEDPRAFYHEGKLFVMYCSRGGPDMKSLRPMLAEVNNKTYKTKNIRCLTDEHRSKNWTPIVNDPTGISNEKTGELVFLDRIFPVSHVKINYNDVNTPPAQRNFKEVTPSSIKHWIWGNVSGGTHAEKLDNGYYLSFIHSWFFYEERRAYVMGAVLLDKEYPHKPVAISQNPILWDKIYSYTVKGAVGPVFQEAWQPMLDRVIFPCGFVIKADKEGRQLVHLSCGENDNSIVMVTMDLKALLGSLQEVDA